MLLLLPSSSVEGEDVLDKNTAARTLNSNIEDSIAVARDPRGRNLEVFCVSLCGLVVGERASGRLEGVRWCSPTTAKLRTNRNWF